MATSEEINKALLQFLIQNTKESTSIHSYKIPIGKLETFDENNETFITYLQRLENYLELNELQGSEEDVNKKKVQILISCLSPKHFQLLTDLTSPVLPKSKTYDELVQLLKTYLCPQPNEVAEQNRFYNRIQQEGESVSTFLKELRRLTINCNFNCSNCKVSNIDIHLRTQFIRGLRNNEIKERLLQESELTLQKSVEISLAMESSRQDNMLTPNLVITQPVNKIVANQTTSIRSITEKKKLLEKLKGKCFRCGKNDHKANNCKLTYVTCSKCNLKGHLASVCMKNITGNKIMQNSNKSFQKQTDLIETDSYITPEDNDSINIIEELEFHSVTSSKTGKYIVTPDIDGVTVTMEYDTGAAVSSMSLHDFTNTFPHKSITKVDNIKLKTYTGEPIELVGISNVEVKLNGGRLQGRLFVVRNNVDSIFGREWIRPLNVSIHNINETAQLQANLLELINQAKSEIFSEFGLLFSKEVGKVPDIKIKLPLIENAQPKFFKYRVPPVALKQKIENELQSLQEQGIISKQNNTEWGTPIVPILKGDGTVRICADYKISLNSQLQSDHYPIPRIEEIFNKMNNGQYFTTLDLSKAYLHLEMDEESAILQSISTHIGVFKVNRLMFGIKTAPSIWQRFMDSVLAGIEGVAVFFDDIVIQGRTLQEAKLRTVQVLKLLQTHNLHVNKEKSSFFQESVSYLGHIIDKNGLHKSPDKITAVMKSPRPTNVSELKQFLGLVNYYYRFLPDLASKLHPLYELLKKQNQFKWSKECNDAFLAIKKEMTSDTVLTPFSTEYPLLLATDASPYGLSAVLSHKMPDGSERPIAFASRTLSKAEKNYSHIIKEATAIHWGVQKFFQYLYGRKFTLITDNKPLTTIFHPSKNLPPLTATRLLHYAIYLSGFQYNIQYRRSCDHTNADYLSRFPVESKSTTEFEDFLNEKAIFQVQLNALPVSNEQVRKATAQDKELCLIYNALQTSSHIMKPEEFRGLEGELTLENGCLYRGIRLVIPVSLRKLILEELHTAHTGITKMKELARQYCWWPSINYDIETFVKSCKPCALIRNNPSKYSQPWPSSQYPWERIHIDHAGPFKGNYFLIVVDSYSKWLEVFQTRSITSSATIYILREIFARFGLPRTVVSDNGPAFISEEFGSFMQSNGINHKKMAPYHPASNGQAERYVQTVKKKLKAMTDDPGDLHTNLCRFLLQNRRVINMATERSPAEMMFKRNLRTRLDLLKSTYKTNEYPQGKLRNFFPGDNVQVRDYRHPDEKWKFGKIISRTGDCHYEVGVNGELLKRHVDQILPSMQDMSNNYLYQHPPRQSISNTNSLNSPNAETTSSVTESELQQELSKTIPEASTEDKRSIAPMISKDSEPVLRRSSRVIRKPDRLNL